MINEKYISKFLFLIFLAGVMGFAVQAEAATVETNSGCLNFRSSKGSWGSLRKTKRCLRSGTQVKVLGRHKRNRNYLKVKVGKRTGYIWAANVNQSSSPKYSNNSRRDKTYVGNNKHGQVRTGSGCLNFRTSRTSRGSLRKTGVCLDSGTNLKILGQHKRNRKYLKVEANGKTGYVWAANVNLNSSGKNSNDNDHNTNSKKNTDKNKYNQIKNAKVHTGSGCLNFRTSRRLRKTGTCLKSGTDLKVLGHHAKNKKYLKVKANGKIGYVWAANVVSNTSDKNSDGPKTRGLKNKPRDLPVNLDKLPEFNLDAGAIVSEEDPKAKSIDPKPSDDLPDFNLESPEVSESNDPKVGTDSKLTRGLSKDKLDSGSTASEEATNGEKKNLLDKAIAKYKTSLKEAFNAELIARAQEDREKKLRFEVGGKTIRNKEAQREATQKRLAADSILDKTKKQHANLLKMGAKDIKKPFLDLPPRNKKEAAELLANQKEESLRLKKIEKAAKALQAAKEKRKAEADRIAAEKKRLADAAEKKRQAEADRIAAEKELEAAAAEEKRLAEATQAAEKKKRADALALAEKKKREKAAAEKRKKAFNRCIKDIQGASKKIDRTGANLDRIFKRGGYKNFHYFKGLTRTGKKWYLNEAKRVVERNGDSLSSFKYGLPMMSSIQTSLAPINQHIRACKQSCRKLSNKVQHQKQLKRKCQQLKAVYNGFSNLVAEKSEAAFTPAIRALRNMGGTRGNHQAIARFTKALEASQKPIAQVIPLLPEEKPASDTVNNTARIAL